MNHCAIIDCQGKVGSHFFEIDDNKQIAKEHIIGLKPEDYVVQRFTGLIDINNKEIYEGDILYGEVDFRTDISGDMYTFRGVVRYNPPMFVVDTADFPLTQYAKLEVLGNIQEHPELIAKSNAE